jgi:hypothetical protein
MRTLVIYPLALLVALGLTACSVLPGVSNSPSLGSPSSSSAPAVAPATPAQPPTTVAASGSPTTAPSDPTTAAIQAVIQKANQEQQDAFAKNDPTLMQDTATSSYYNQLVQINSDMANGGVSSIKLVKIEWGQITSTSSTTAQATTFETWQTVFSDGSTDQTREQNDYTLVLTQGSWQIQSDNNPGVTPGQPAGSPASPPSGLVPPGSPSPSTPPAPAPPSGQSGVSRNWSGYAATSGNFTAVTGTWTVPQSQSSGRTSAGATWVGIGGVQSQDLIQAGTEETTNGSGTVQYDAWVETLPQAPRQLPFAVSPGDSVTVSISQKSAGQWMINFVNHTTGETYQTPVQYTSSLSSAEWVEEAPSAGRRVLPIDNFGSVQFSGGTAVDNGQTVTIAQSGAQPITLAGSRGSAIATPSVLTADGQGFTVSQSASTPSAPQPTGSGSAF